MSRGRSYLSVLFALDPLQQPRKMTFFVTSRK
ncbi:TPA_asm: hypothetical protein [Porphyromonas phage phage028a_KCOM2799]|uniref:Uncharacterized protein n=1 Tax=Porphyromonas phage phage028a_KCOM2799 TaxID=3154118 RepID=A0AAT9JEP9_9CAUD